MLRCWLFLLTVQFAKYLCNHRNLCTDSTHLVFVPSLFLSLSLTYAHKYIYTHTLSLPPLSPLPSIFPSEQSSIGVSDGDILMLRRRAPPEIAAAPPHSQTPLSSFFPQADGPSGALPGQLQGLQHAFQQAIEANSVVVSDEQPCRKKGEGV